MPFTLDPETARIYLQERGLVARWTGRYLTRYPVRHLKRGRRPFPNEEGGFEFLGEEGPSEPDYLTFQIALLDDGTYSATVLTEAGTEEDAKEALSKITCEDNVCVEVIVVHDGFRGTLTRVGGLTEMVLWVVRAIPPLKIEGLQTINDFDSFANEAAFLEAARAFPEANTEVELLKRLYLDDKTHLEEVYKLYPDLKGRAPEITTESELVKFPLNEKRTISYQGSGGDKVVASFYDVDWVEASNVRFEASALIRQAEDEEPLRDTPPAGPPKYHHPYRRLPRPDFEYKDLAELSTETEFQLVVWSKKTNIPLFVLQRHIVRIAELAKTKLVVFTTEPSEALAVDAVICTYRPKQDPPWMEEFWGRN